MSVKPPRHSLARCIQHLRRLQWDHHQQQQGAAANVVWTSDHSFSVSSSSSSPFSQSVTQQLRPFTPAHPPTRLLRHRQELRTAARPSVRSPHSATSHSGSSTSSDGRRRRYVARLWRFGLHSALMMPRACVCVDAVIVDYGTFLGKQTPTNSKKTNLDTNASSQCKWLMVAILSLLSGINQSICYSYAPIASIAESRWAQHVRSFSTTRFPFNSLILTLALL